MAQRQPPTWAPEYDGLALECGITPVTFKRPLHPGLSCHYCGGEADSRDHIVPDSQGGANNWWNLVPSCKACNEEKDNRQACACMFCLRAIALWYLGYRRDGRSRGEKRRTYRNNRAAARDVA